MVRSTAILSGKASVELIIATCNRLEIDHARGRSKRRKHDRGRFAPHSLVFTIIIAGRYNKYDLAPSRTALRPKLPTISRPPRPLDYYRNNRSSIEHRWGRVPVLSNGKITPSETGSSAGVALFIGQQYDVSIILRTLLPPTVHIAHAFLPIVHIMHAS